MLSRKQFVESQGATCKNWTWSWSFVNHKEKIVVFGAWDIYTEDSMAKIFSVEWKTSSNGRKAPGFDQSLEHIRLIEEKGYKLKTFAMKYSDARVDENEIGPAKIESFTPKLESRNLKRVGDNWYASDGKISTRIPEEVDEEELLIEGAAKTVTISYYERNPAAKAKCLAHHGYKCAVCTFDFKEFYGSIGQDYIHVHHIVPLSERGKQYKLNPIKDLVPICPNCHAMIHRTHPILTVAQLRAHLEAKNA